ncbi:hypothetical protein DPQ33_08900 [Oceanidesulfovibrio indonesiensis]|uniref:Lipoprotein n=1 Tax=Oceanidesulfovibrio indonesiensis TaxID=54767 RepID=A0A7M3MEI4_9BACT|nr:hypothetical protein [Oceanidesulfovibrio indonesiensis]TVM17294.1 hypothetical protein DPQ33_08900 [Oceanidesulfovibrio indonesiensis]
MTKRSNKSKLFHATVCTFAACLLLAANGCALLQGKQQEPVAHEPAVAEKEEVRQEEPKKAAQKPAEKQKAAGQASAESEPESEETAALEQPEFDYEAACTLDESGASRDDSLGMDTRPAVMVQGEGPYPTSGELQLAADAALADGRVVGGIASFDAFPDIPGEDTVGQVFREKGNPGIRIKLFAFHAPGREYHRVIYGYVVEDTVNDKVSGYFDEDLDGVFEKVTLKPVIKPAALFSK